VLEFNKRNGLEDKICAVSFDCRYLNSYFWPISSCQLSIFKV